MNCREIEPLLLAERDGGLSPESRAALSEHLASCAHCRGVREAYEEAIAYLKHDAATVAVPDAAVEWREIRARMDVNPRAEDRKRPLATVLWFAAPLAAAAAIAVSLVIHRPTPPTPATAVAVTPVEAAPPAVPTIAYVDKDSGWLVVWAADADASTNG